jgi:hypothetical protein
MSCYTFSSLGNVLRLNPNANFKNPVSPVQKSSLSSAEIQFFQCEMSGSTFPGFSSTIRTGQKSVAKISNAKLTILEFGERFAIKLKYQLQKSRLSSAKIQVVQCEMSGSTFPGFSLTFRTGKKSVATISNVKLKMSS